ncbi:hypothetical protein [Goodfellowiella coeruleoviolacea]|uniref:Uncharacterized protein n=1 Tax=Goodfellowiella coeruleoviolacea TaxID=334858 RepID=A0AAE3KIW8_9PSEU|nr:hypothetical protein [Goodfellowiella coeruleoviolacea]MCP2168427.1 hypothetical protein [Goodfellowiella coeruleoviolacea]
MFVRGRSTDEVVACLPDVFYYESRDERVDADQAWSSAPGQRLYLADEGGWCQLWDPDQRFPPRLDELGDLADTTALAVVFSSVSDIYALWLYADGELVRHTCAQGGRPEPLYGRAVGEPLPAESRVGDPADGPDENTLWAVIKEVTGLSADTNQSFAVHDVEF